MTKEIVHLGKHYFPDFGGIETATQSLAETGVELGATVTCYTSGTSACWRKHYELNGVRVRRSTTLGRLLSTPLAPSLLWRRPGREAVVHLHLPNPLAELSVLLGSAGKKELPRLVPFLHALPFRGQGLGGWWFRFITRPILRKCRRLLVSNQYLVDSFPALAEFAPKTTVLPFVSATATEQEVRGWWASGKENTVLCVGRLVPYKGYETMLRAWREIRVSHPNFHLVILGDGPLKASLEQEIQRLGLEDCVRLRSGANAEEKVAWFRRARVFALPSLNHSETFGIAALEAMAHGLPLVTTDLSTGVKLLARGGACGAVARAGDAASLATAMTELLAAPDGALEELGLRNRTFVAENFSPEKLQAMYREVLQG